MSFERLLDEAFGDVNTITQWLQKFAIDRGDGTFEWVYEDEGIATREKWLVTIHLLTNFSRMDGLLAVTTKPYKETATMTGDELPLADEFGEEIITTPKEFYDTFKAFGLPPLPKHLGVRRRLGD